MKISCGFSNIVIVGVGLIGGSLARALKIVDNNVNIVGVGRNEAALQRAIELNVIDSYSLDLSDAVRSADLVVIAVPVLSTLEVLKTLKSSISKHAVFTDVGSVKGRIIKEVESIFEGVPENFVPGHPIAGSEKSGIDAINPDLYRQHKVILTPLPATNLDAVAKVKAMWQAVGAQVLEMDVDHHDQVLAVTSHLPHLLAFSLVDTLAHQESKQEIFRYAAGGFRDFTRLASSDPTMWHDIFMANRSAVLEGLDAFSDGLAQLRSALEHKDGDKLKCIFTRAKSTRDHFTEILDQRAEVDPMKEQYINFVAYKGDSLAGVLRVPGDKSISHRSIMLGSIAEGVTEIEGFLEGEDSLATLQSFRDMGVVIDGPHQERVTVHGVGMHGLTAPKNKLYMGNSGTSMRLLSGLLCAQGFDSKMIGDESLSKRPMRRVINPLEQMGGQVDSNDGCPPLAIKGKKKLIGINYQMPMASAQVKSCVLLAGLYAEGETVVIEPAPTRDHTERMLVGFGYSVAIKQLSPMKKEVTIVGGGKLFGTKIDVPADISSAAFFIVAATLVKGSNLLLEHVGVNPTRIGVLNILRLMGAEITIENEHSVGGEPVADIRVRYAKLKGIDIPVDQVPLAIDEFPAIFIAAACAQGTTTLKEAKELRVKECDRIQVMADGLSTLGIKVQTMPDGLVIEGGEISGGTVDSHDDHRIAMAFAVAGQVSKNEIKIIDCCNVATSFPNFVGLSNQVGMNVILKDES